MLTLLSFSVNVLILVLEFQSIKLDDIRKKLISLTFVCIAGFNHLVPYLGTIFLVIMLIDRERKDNTECKKKYGTDWEKYCTIVKYRIIPGLY